MDRISSFNTGMGGTDLVNRIVSLEKENDGLRKRREKNILVEEISHVNLALVVEKMQKSQDSLEKRLNDLEQKSGSLGGSAPAKQAAPAKPAPAKAAAKDDDDDVDLFGSSDVRNISSFCE